MHISKKYSLILNKAISFEKNNQLEIAKNYYSKVYAQYPAYPNLTENISKICIALKAYEEAHIYLLRSLNKNPKEYTVLVTCAYVQLKIGLLSEAEKNLRKAISINPEKIEAHLSLTAVLIASENINSALLAAIDALDIQPQSITALNNLGAVFTKLNKLNDAKLCFETSIKINSKENIYAQYNLGSIEYKLKNINLSIQIFENILNSNSIINNEILIQTEYALSYSYLYIGNLKQGWEFYKHGFDLANSIQNRRAPNRSFEKPYWNFEPLNGKVLLIWCEQGLGDELIFLSALHELCMYSKNIIVECDKRLIMLLSTTFPEIYFRSTIYKNDFKLSSIHSDFDFHIPIGDLFGFYRQDIKNFQRSMPFLNATQELKDYYRTKLSNISSKKKIGISWRSGKLNLERNVNYTQLTDWENIFEMSNDFEFINLQYGDCEEEIATVEELYNIKIIRWNDLDLKNDLHSVSALIASLDMVISVGTAVSAIAGATGAATLLLSHRGWDNFGTNYYPAFNSIKVIMPSDHAPVSDCLSLVVDELKNFKNLP